MAEEFKFQPVLKKLTKSQLKVLASDIRADILSSVLKNGGHLSSNLGTVEMEMSLLKNFDPLKDDILFDVGHQMYTYKILTGRNLSTIRKTGGVSPFSLKEESPYDKYDSGHAANSISVAYGMAKAKALQGDDSYTIAVIGDSSVSSGLSMEALGLLSQDRNTKLIIIINDNDMSIGQDVGFMGKKFQSLRTSRLYFRMSSSFGKHLNRDHHGWRFFLHLRNFKDMVSRLLIKPNVFESMGLKYVGPFDGHDFDSLDLAMEKAKAVSKNRSVIVHVLTKKGFGYAPAMSDESGEYHGVGPGFDDPDLPKFGYRDFTDVKGEWLFKYMEKDKKAIVITPAMIKGSGLTRVFHDYPSRSVDVGICEEHAVSLASGYALKGYHPIVDIYSTFMQRSYDEIIEDISREKVSTLFIVERAGLVGEDGSSHHGLYDVAMIKSIPFCKVYMPFDEKSALYLLNNVSFEGTQSTFIRFSKEMPLVFDKDIKDEEGFVFMNRKRQDTLVLAIGPLGYNLLQELPDTYDKAILLDLLPETDSLKKNEIDIYKNVIIYDPYSTSKGSSEQIGSLLLSLNYQGKFISYAFDNDFVTFGQTKDLLRISDMDVESVKKKIVSLDKTPTLV